MGQRIQDVSKCIRKHEDAGTNTLMEWTTPNWQKEQNTERQLEKPLRTTTEATVIMQGVHLGGRLVYCKITLQMCPTYVKIKEGEEEVFRYFISHI